MDYCLGEPDGSATMWTVDGGPDVGGIDVDRDGLLDDMLTRVVSYMTRSKGWLSWGWNRIIDDGLARVAAFRSVYPAKLRAAAADLQKRLLDTLAVGMSRIQRKGTKNAQPHVVRQEKMAPPKRLAGGVNIETRKAPGRDELDDQRIRELGINHERLTYRYSGRDFRLTDVAGKVVREILS